MEVEKVKPFGLRRFAINFDTIDTTVLGPETCLMVIFKSGAGVHPLFLAPARRILGFFVRYQQAL